MPAKKEAPYYNLDFLLEELPDEKNTEVKKRSPKEISEAAKWKKKAAQWKKKTEQLTNRLNRFAGWKEEAEGSREEIKKMNARNRELMNDLLEKDEQISKLRRDLRAAIAKNSATE